MQKKRLAVLGSTGSIGTQTLDVAARDTQIEIVGLSANSNIDLLEKQAIQFNPRVICVMQEDKAKMLDERLKAHGLKIEVVTGEKGLMTVATLDEADIVLTAVVGMVGLIPTLKAIDRGKTIALANKETLVTAGELVMQRAKEKGVAILPVDSEHSAIFQSLQGSHKNEVEKLVLTASGGPFRTYTKEQLEKVTVSDALHHPNWVMGSKITIDSATLMNKGLEVIEAKYLFDVTPDQIDVVVHKESIVHSMVTYKDGSTIAQLASPDMRHPISYALYYPNRRPAPFMKPLNLAEIGQLSFEAPRKDLFPCLSFAYEALKVGGSMPAVLNAANEIVVESFLKGEVAFLDIPKIIHTVMEKHICISSPTLEEILECDRWAREYSRKKVKTCLL